MTTTKRTKTRREHAELMARVRLNGIKATLDEAARTDGPKTRDSILRQAEDATTWLLRDIVTLRLLPEEDR
jgi:hypothetical protein